MLNSGVLDIGIGLMFVYLILGMMCTTVNEWIAQLLRLRAKTLRDGITVLLSSSGSPRDAVRPEDINAARLVNRLIVPGDKLAAVLGVDPGAIIGYQPRRDELADAGRVLAARLNTVLDDPALWQKIDVGRVSVKTLEAVKKGSSGKRLQSANLALLHEAYPEEIAGLGQSFYDHPLIKSLAKPGRHPSYVPARTFAMVLIDILGASSSAHKAEGKDPLDSNETGDPVDRIKFSIAALPDGDIKRTLTTLMQAADDGLTSFQKNLESWFEDTMDRVSGWYKAKTQVITIIVAMAITISANADTIKIARTLFLNPVLRERFVQDASVTAGHAPAPDGIEQPRGLTPEERLDLGELAGWSNEFREFHSMGAAGKSSAELESARNDDAFPGVGFLREWRLSARWLARVVSDHLIGWLLTGAAVSLGAPFWFDTLNKFMNIRAAGTAPNEKGQDQSKA